MMMLRVCGWRLVQRRARHWLRCAFERTTLASALRIRNSEVGIDAGDAARDLARPPPSRPRRRRHSRDGLTDLGLENIGGDDAIDDLVELAELGVEARAVGEVAVEHVGGLDSAASTAGSRSTGARVASVSQDMSRLMTRSTSRGGLAQLGPDAGIAVDAEPLVLLATAPGNFPAAARTCARSRRDWPGRCRR